LSWIVSQFDRMLAFADEAVAGGYVLAIGLVCVLQYLLHFYKLSVAGREASRQRNEMNALQDDLQSVQRDRTMSRLENGILREFVAQTEIKTALELMMRRFVPHTSKGFSAFLKWNPDAQPEYEIYQSRGLSEESCRELYIDDELRQRIIRERVVVLDGSDAGFVMLWQSLTPTDRRKIRQLNLAALGDADDLAGILITTALYPPGAPQEQQVELTRRLMQSVSTDFKRFQTLEQKTHELRFTNEMLALRSIADRKFNSPLAMIQEFLNQWMKKIDADRVVLYLKNKAGEGLGKPLIRCGIENDGSIEINWKKLEDRLTEQHLADGQLKAYSSHDLDELCVERTASGAIVAPLVQQQQSIGLACFTRCDNFPFDDTQISLATWAAEYLGEVILRVLNQAIVEKEAREDSLTELANRRAFDQQIKREIQLAREKKREVSLLLFDLDRFKSINDTYGHQAGDLVLRRTAQMLKDEAREAVRTGDRVLVARYGGEEMAVLLPNVGLVGAHRIGESIRRAVDAETFSFEGRDIHVTLSVGIATCPGHADKVHELISAADAALYEAKETGRNQVVTADSLPQEQPV
jgi:diguanylate cyclase (GGDEF)-like protein